MLLTLPIHLSPLLQFLPVYFYTLWLLVGSQSLSCGYLHKILLIYFSCTSLVFLPVFLLHSLFTSSYILPLLFQKPLYRPQCCFVFFFATFLNAHYSVLQAFPYILHHTSRFLPFLASVLKYYPLLYMLFVNIFRSGSCLLILGI